MFSSHRALWQHQNLVIEVCIGRAGTVPPDWQQMSQAKTFFSSIHQDCMRATLMYIKKQKAPKVIFVYICYTQTTLIGIFFFFFSNQKPFCEMKVVRGTDDRLCADGQAQCRGLQGLNVRCRKSSRCGAESSRSRDHALKHGPGLLLKLCEKNTPNPLPHIMSV